MSLVKGKGVGPDGGKSVVGPFSVARALELLWVCMADAAPTERMIASVGVVLTASDVPAGRFAAFDLATE